MIDAIITCQDCVLALKKLKRSNPAKNIAAELGTSSRAVATIEGLTNARSSPNR